MSIQLMSLLTFHLFCNAVAEIAPLSLAEAQQCSANFEELKMLLHPELSMAEYERLSSRTRAQVSVDSYRYYRSWVSEHAELVDHLEAQARSNARFVGY